MKHLTTVASMLLVFAASGQGTVTPKVSTDFKRILFGVNFSPDRCYRTLGYYGSNAVISSEINKLNHEQMAKNGYTAGFNFCYNINRHCGIETGLQYSNKGFADKYRNPPSGPQVELREEFSGVQQYKVIYNYTYIDVPVRAVFSVGDKRIHFIASAGITTNFLLRATHTLVFDYYNGGKKRVNSLQEYSKYEPFSFSPTISIGVDYKIGKKITIRAEPTFRYQLLETVKTHVKEGLFTTSIGSTYVGDYPVRTHLWSAGLNITCYYALK